MVQLIADLQGTFMIEFDLNEIERLRSYAEIRSALSEKGVFVAGPMNDAAEPRLMASEDGE